VGQKCLGSLKISLEMALKVICPQKNCPSLRSGQFRGQKSLGPLEISLEKAHYVVCPQKKIISRIFKISGALIVTSNPIWNRHLIKRTV
jgi:hypothetical protein